MSVLALHSEGPQKWKAPSLYSQPPLGQGSAHHTSGSPGRKLEMTQPKFLLLKWWGFL